MEYFAEEYDDEGYYAIIHFPIVNTCYVLTTLMVTGDDEYLLRLESFCERSLKMKSASSCINRIVASNKRDGNYSKKL